MNKEVIRLAGLLACIALAASRIGLVGHELVGHGGVALAAGCDVTEVQLFWFAGGWISYGSCTVSPAASIAISLGGIAFEVVLGTLLWRLVRGDSLGRSIVRWVGIGLIGHGTWYLAAGVFHGFGDGVGLYRALGEARVVVAVGAGIVTCTAAFVGARASIGPLVQTLPGTRRQRIVGFIVAAVFAGGLHAGLTIGELRLRRDQAYAQVMRPQRERVIASELQAWERERVARGDAPSAADRRAARARLEREHPSFPFVFLLAAATILSLIAGIVRTRVDRDERVSTGLLVRAAVVALASICTVIVLGTVLPG